jgi:hypothetical protein
MIGRRKRLQSRKPSAAVAPLGSSYHVRWDEGRLAVCRSMSEKGHGFPDRRRIIVVSVAEIEETKPRIFCMAENRGKETSRRQIRLCRSHQTLNVAKHVEIQVPQVVPSSSNSTYPGFKAEPGESI